jgi:hypothetical protein
MESALQTAVFVAFAIVILIALVALWRSVTDVHKDHPILHDEVIEADIDAPEEELTEMSNALLSGVAPKAILLVEDGGQDYNAVLQAFKEAGLHNPVCVYHCQNGDEVMDMLDQRGLVNLLREQLMDKQDKPLVLFHWI